MVAPCKNTVVKMTACVVVLNMLAAGTSLLWIKEARQKLMAPLSPA